MEYYCAMVITGEEKSFKESALQLLPQGHFYIFERRLHNRSRGWFDAPLFPGYVFFGVDQLTPEFFETLRTIKGFCRILYDNQNPVKISGEALEELQGLGR